MGPAQLAASDINAYNACIPCLPEFMMANLTVRNLDDTLKQKLRMQAALHGCSMEEEVRSILRHALAAEKEPVSGLGQRIRQRFQPLGGVDLAVEERQPVRESLFTGDAE